MTNKTVTSFIDNEYKSYSEYVLSSRSIPSCIDGLKVSQRKVLYTAIKSASNKKIKTSSLGGNCISLANYLHGPASLESAIPAMVAEWNNNIPLLDGEGSFGSRLINAPAAARYTYSGLSNSFDKYFIDNDLLDNYQTLDAEDPVPKHYLPVIPWVLVNPIKGIAIGYATEIQPRDPKILKKLCIDYISGKNIDNRKCLPYFNNFKGSVYENNGKYICRGKYEHISKTKIRITEIPVGIERERYIHILDKLDDNNDIVSYVDNCNKSGFDFTITFKRHRNMTEARILKMFKLEKTLNENLTTIDENGKLKLFDNVIEIIKYFCTWRVQQYPIRYDYYIKRDMEQLDFLQDKLLFINSVNNHKIVLKNKTSADIRSQALAISIKRKYITDLMNLRISSFSKESVDKLKLDIKNIMKDLKLWASANYIFQFTEDLKRV